MRVNLTTDELAAVRNALSTRRTDLLERIAECAVGGLDEARQVAVDELHLIDAIRAKVADPH